MPQQAVETQCRKETQRCIDLPLPRLPDELQCRKQRERGGQTRLPVPQPSCEVVHQHDAAQAGDGGWHQKREPQRSRQLQKTGHHPEIERRLVRVVVIAHLRNQPQVMRYHVARYKCKPRFISWPRVAQADTGSKQEQCEATQPGNVDANCLRAVATSAQQLVDNRIQGWRRIDDKATASQTDFQRRQYHQQLDASRIALQSRIAISTVRLLDPLPSRTPCPPLGEQPQSTRTYTLPRG